MGAQYKVSTFSKTDVDLGVYETITRKTTQFAVPSPNDAAAELI